MEDEYKKHTTPYIENLIEKDKQTELLIPLKSYEGVDRIITSEEAWANLEEERSRPTKKFFSKIPSLDGMLEGFREGDLVVISGPTKNGKTALAQSFTHSFAEEQVPCLWFSYEMAMLEFLQKFGEPMPNFTLPNKLEGNSLDWLEERIMESIAKHKTKIVFIDHLHFLLDMSFISQKGNVSLMIGSIMRRLKSIALKWNITIFLIAHTTKINFDRHLDLSDIRDSSFISQEADTVLMIWRIKNKETMEFENRALLALLANRRTGRTGKIILQLNKNKFTEIEQFKEE